MAKQIIFSFYTDRVIGESFSAYVGERLEDGSISLGLKKLAMNILQNFDLSYSEVERQIIRLADELSHKSLLKSFSKKHSSLEVFLSANSAAFFKTTFRQSIDQRLNKIIELCKVNSIPLYFMNPRGFITSEPIKMLPDNGLAHYLFDWSEEGLLYSLKVSYEQKSHNLQDENTHVLTDKPAHLIHQNCLICVDGINGNKLKPFLNKDHVLIVPENQKKYFENFVYNLLGKSSVEARGFSITESHNVPEAILRVTREKQNEPLLIPCFKYPSKEIAANYKSSPIVTINSSQHPPAFTIEHRHKAHEEEGIKLLLSLGLIYNGTAGYLIPHTSDTPLDPARRLIDFMQKNLKTLQSYPFVIRQETDIDYNI